MSCVWYFPSRMYVIHDFRAKALKCLRQARVHVAFVCPSSMDKTISSSPTLCRQSSFLLPVLSRCFSDLEVSKIRSSLFCSLYARPSPSRQGNCATRLGSDIAYKHLTSLPEHPQYRAKKNIHARRHVASGRPKARAGEEVATTDDPRQNAIPVSLLLEPTCAALEINQRWLSE
jgi:hypothetical protein